MTIEGINGPEKVTIGSTCTPEDDKENLHSDTKKGDVFYLKILSLLKYLLSLFGKCPSY